MDIDFNEDAHARELRQHGISKKLEVDALIYRSALQLDGDIEHIGAREDNGKKTYIAFFRNSRAKLEFEIKHGQLVMLDACHVNVCMYGDFGPLIISPADGLGETDDEAKEYTTRKDFELLKFPIPTGDAHEER